jgi:hypothetical protein
MTPAAPNARSYRLALVFWALSVGVFASGMWLASLYFPTPFHWRYGLISSLLSRKDNPHGYVFANAAMILSMPLASPVFRELSRALESRHPRLTRVAWGFAICGLLFAVVVGFEKLLGFSLSSHVRKLHEICAGIALLSVTGATIIYAVLCHETTPLWSKILTFALVVFAPAGMCCSQWYVRRFRPELGWVDSEWDARDVSVFLSFALWQWLFVSACYGTLLSLLYVVRPRRTEAVLGEGALSKTQEAS